MLKRLADSVLRYRRAILVTAVVLSLVGGGASASLFDKLTAGGFADPGAESARAADALERVFGQAPPNLTLLVTAPDGVDGAAARAAGSRLTQRLSSEPGVTNVFSYWTAGRPRELRGTSGNRALVLATITGDATTVEKRIADLAPRYHASRDGLRVQVGGYAMLQHEIVTEGQEDATRGEMIVFPVTLVLLVFVFGSLVAAALPLAVALVTMLLSLGTMWILAGVTELSSLAVSVVTLLGLGLAIDYSLLIVSRYREELASGKEAGEAIRATMGSAGRTVVVSAITVAVVVSSLAWFPLVAVRSMAYVGILTPLLAALASVTVLPALLAVLGHRIDRGRLLRRRASLERSDDTGFWHRLASFVMRRPLPLATAVTAFLLLLGTPFLGIRLGMPDERILPESSMARQVATTIAADFAAGEQNALQVVALDVPGGPPAIAAYAQRLSGLPDVARVDAATGTYARRAQVAPAGPTHRQFAAGDAAYFSVVPARDSPDHADRLVGQIRSLDAPLRTAVGGLAAVNRDATAALERRLPYALGSAAVVMLGLLFVVTGSVLVPFIALVLSGLSLTATFGALVWIFQDGHLTGLLGDFTATGTIAATVPVLLFALAFGLAMDYQIFLLSRIREEYDACGDGTIAVARGLQRTGRIVTAAAILISIVFLAFAMSDIALSKAYGIGLPLAVLMDATLIRGVLLPALMRLGGRWTWWAPQPLRRLHAVVGFSGTSPRVSPPRSTPLSLRRRNRKRTRWSAENNDA